MRPALPCLMALGLLTLALPAGAQAPAPPPPTPAAERAEYIRSHYTKLEYRVPMRDGVRLFTAVYVPNDASTSKRYPLLIMRTTYSIAPYGADRYRSWLGPSAGFEKDGFIFVVQDVRGRYMSEGEYLNVRPHQPSKRGPKDIDESTDAYDTIDWLVKNVPGNNGKVGHVGDLLSRVLCLDGSHRLASGAQGGLAPGPDWRLVLG